MAATNKHVPLRRCIACRRSRPQAELVRLVKEDAGWQLDPTRKAPGRGAWVCTDEPRCRSVKALGRPLRAQAARLSEVLQRHLEPHLEPHPSGGNTNGRTSNSTNNRANGREEHGGVNV